MNKTAFSGIRVLDMGQIYNGPYCGLLLALLGADVIKIEPPGGERLRYRSTDRVETHEFMMLNSNKRSIVVDLKTEAGRDLFRDLVCEVDVVIENFAPGAMERMGLPPASLLDLNPRLIYASGKGYGNSGPYAHMSAMDITVQAMAGVIASTGFPDGPPTKTGPAFADIMGGVHLFGGVAAALYQREKTGRGQIVEVSMHDTIYPALASPLGAIFNDPSRTVPERTGNRHSGLAVAPYNVYPASDGHIAIMSVSERHASGVLMAVGGEPLASDPRFADRASRIANIDALDAAVGAWTATLDRWTLVERLAEHSVPSAPVLTVREVADDRHLRERGMIRDVEHPVRGTIPVPGSAIRLEDSPVNAVRAAPSLDADAEDVLHDLLRADAGRIAALIASGALGART
ncbi:formyl-CoA transferase [Sphingomonas sp. OV641]|uniref:CaiB/BaiF CoA transferase family protein n=1 Tax=Sphingomonas sp. OV641 TaxID=1881068 RepID=UPI0008D176FA|nr:CoA transferase [Sphingomonas sp. OV641]SEK03747.1 formyl-CoA transferase [Sphingomonas sp. OV641]